MVPPGRTLRIGELDVRVRELGDGPPVLCLAGLGYSSWCYEDVMAALAPRFRMIALDNRGTGRSGKPPGPYTIDQMTADAAGVLDALAVPSAHVLGHSMGGFLAQSLALARPELVRSLVLVGTSTGRSDEPVDSEVLAAWYAAEALEPRTFAEQTMSLSFREGWTDEHPAAFRSYLERRLEFPTPQRCWRAQFDAIVALAAQGLATVGVRCPALVIHGTDDRIIPYRHGVELTAALPSARLVTFDGAGHAPHLEEPARFVAVVADFLTAV